jgi:hypothetical protein
MNISALTIAALIIATPVASASPAFVQQIGPNLQPRATDLTISLNNMIAPLVEFEQSTAKLRQSNSWPTGGLSLISQDGENNLASISQIGNQNAGLIIQAGNLNTASVTQTGSHNIGIISQIGYGNSASLSQTGNNHAALISQQGTGNVAIVHQR